MTRRNQQDATRADVKAVNEKLKLLQKKWREEVRVLKQRVKLLEKINTAVRKKSCAEERGDIRI